MLTPSIHVEKRKSEFVHPKMRRKYEIVSFEEMLHDYRYSFRVKNMSASRKSAQLAASQKGELGKGRKLLTRGNSSK